MSLGTMLTTALEWESQRAYSNLYEIEITTNAGFSNTARLSNLTYLASKLDFEDNFGFNLEHNDAIQGFRMTGINRIKGVNITFKETSSYNVIDVLKDWINAIYDFEGHFFNDNVNPTGTIKIKLNDGTRVGVLVIEDAIPKSLSYPSYSWSDSNPIEITASFTAGWVYWQDGVTTTVGSFNA
jgi:hypothetical protein